MNKKLLASICTFQRSRFSSFSCKNQKNLNIQYFIDNKDAFLSSISFTSTDTDATKCSQNSQQEKRLISLIDSMGSQLEKPPIFGYNHKQSDSASDDFDQEPIARDSFTIRQMLACNMHLGHAIHKCNVNMKPFIFGEREGIHVIDLEKSLFYLRKAVLLIEEIVREGGNVLFVGCTEHLERLVYETALKCNQFYLNGPWTKGLITNRRHLLGDTKYLPDLIVVFDYGSNNADPVIEANKEGIPCIAVCDTNADPSIVSYPIPANDDSYESIELIAVTLMRAANEGKAKSFHNNHHGSLERICQSIATS